MIVGETVPSEQNELLKALKKIVEKNRDDWMEPAYIAAEADYAKIVKAEGKRHKAKRKK